MAMTKTDDPLALDLQICFPIYAASNLLGRLYRPVLDELGLTYPQYLVMLVLWEAEPQSVGDLGARLHLDSGTLTPLLKRLEAHGIVKRKRDRVDERRVLVTVTPKGSALRERALRVPETLINHLTGAANESGVTPDPYAAARLRDAVKHMVTLLAKAAARVER
jgi:DNA-binding MarR family transcriptional regulator